MNILISGASGFIGKNLLRKINKKTNHISVISRKNKRNQNKINFIYSDIKNIKKKILYLKSLKPSILIHLAWEGIPDYGLKISKKNLSQQKIFFREINKLKTIKKIIVTGSCFEYGLLKGCYSETSNIKVKTPFSEAKINLYKFLKKNLNPSVSLVWLRLFYVYGKGQRTKGLIPYLLKNIQKNRKIILNEPNAGRDFVNVNDVCKAILLFLKINKHGIYNVGNGKAFTPLFLAKYLIKKTGSSSQLIYKKGKKKILFYGKNNKLKKLGWKPNYDIRNGLVELLKK